MASTAFPAKARGPEAGAEQARAKFADDALEKKFQPKMNEMNADEEAGPGLPMEIRSDKGQHFWLSPQSAFILFICGWISPNPRSRGYKPGAELESVPH